MNDIAKKYPNFDALVSGEARRHLIEVLGSEVGRRAAARVGLAFQSSAARNPKLYECHPDSVAAAVALSAMYDLMPGGPVPDVYLIPRGGLRFRGDGIFQVKNQTIGGKRACLLQCPAV